MCSYTLVQARFSDAKKSDISNKLIQKIIGNNSSMEDYYNCGAFTYVVSDKCGSSGGYYLGYRVENTPEAVESIVCELKSYFSMVDKNRHQIRIRSEEGCIILLVGDEVILRLDSYYDEGMCLSTLEKSVYDLAGYASSCSIPLHQVSICLNCKDKFSQLSKDDFYKPIVGYASAREDLFPEDCKGKNSSEEYCMIVII